MLVVKPDAVQQGMGVRKVEMGVPDQSLSSRDPVGFGRMLREHDRDLRGVVWSVLRDRDAVDDVMQMAYEKAFRSIDGFEHNSTVKTWLHTICYRTAIDYSRHEGRRRHLSLVNIEHEPSHHSTSDAAIARIDLARALDQLDAETRSMMTMTAGLGMSYDEVAAITGVPRGTVASKVSRARTLLRREIER